MLKVAINGFGRIGRLAFRIAYDFHKDEIDIVGINSTGTDIAGWGYLLKYDTVYGLFGHQVSWEGKVVGQPSDAYNPEDEGRGMHTFEDKELGHLIVDGKKIPFFTEKDPSTLPWKDLGVDVVIESTGAFTSLERAQVHLDAGAKKVVISAPAKGGGVKTYVLGVNDHDLGKEAIVSNASCTTNCIAPVAQVMVAKFGVEKAMMTTIHAYTSDQRLQDGWHKDFRRARAAAANIIPTSTGATTAAAETVPELKGLFDGLALRVPVVVGSLADFTFLLKKNVTVEEVNNVFKEAEKNPLYKGILVTTTDPIVSSDIIGRSESSIVDLSLTRVVAGNMVKVVAWYDNEWAYTHRLVEEAIKVGGI